MNDHLVLPGTPDAPLGLDLPARYLQSVREILLTHCPQTEVWAFGSRVSGGCHEASDLDLVLRNPRDLEERTGAAVALKNRFVESNLPIRVDVLDWALIPESFRNEITRAYVVLQSGPPKAMPSPTETPSP